jgi:hypothetical protein
MRESTWLIQRLEKPIPGAYRNPFNFGCGLQMGGLSEEAAALLDPMFSFAYMGAAEFENGKIPKAFSTILFHFREGNGCTGTLKIKGKSVYYICGKINEEYVKKTIMELSQGKLRLKENARFADYFGLNAYKDWVTKTIGWLELDNGFAFFIDETAFNKLHQMFIEYSTPLDTQKEENSCKETV